MRMVNAHTSWRLWWGISELSDQKHRAHNAWHMFRAQPCICWFCLFLFSKAQTQNEWVPVCFSCSLTLPLYSWLASLFLFSISIHRCLMLGKHSHSGLFQAVPAFLLPTPCCSQFRTFSSQTSYLCRGCAFPKIFFRNRFTSKRSTKC